MNASAGASGFTLAELLVVLLIVSLAIGVVANRLGSGKSSSRELSIQIAGALRAARAEATLTGRAEEISLDLAARTLIRDGVAGDRWPDDIDVSVEAAASLSDSGRYGVSFLPDGGSTGLKVVLSSPNDNASITVSWLTGEVREAVERRW